MRDFIHIIFLFIVYLLLINSLIFTTSPCFRATGPQAYNSCTIETLSNSYITFMVAGTLIAAFCTYIYGKNTEQKVSDVIFVVLLLIALGVLSYYLYLPFALKQIGEVEIYLDTLMK
jgi:lysylphosphatidylglycerol synthetase-like protein (DUF2156 family)